MVHDYYIVIYYHNKQIRYYADKDKSNATWTNKLSSCKHFYDPIMAQIVVENARNRGIHSVNAIIKKVVNGNIVSNMNRRNRYEYR